MNNADLAEIRARLRAAAAPERQRERPSLLGAVAKLFAPVEKPARSRQTPPPARRAGLSLAAADEVQPDASARAASSPARLPSASGFGRRREPAPEGAAESFLPLLLLDTRAPPLEDDLIAISPARRLRLARRSPQVGPFETPYLPEDLADPVDPFRTADAQAAPVIAVPVVTAPVVAASIVADPIESAGPERRPSGRTPGLAAEQAARGEPFGAQRELLSHLMRVLAVEQAALDARRFAF